MGRALEILSATGSRDRIGLTELTAMTGIPKPSVHRIAEDLARRGVLIRTELGYHVAPTVRRWSDHDIDAERVALIVHGLEALHERLGGIAWYLRFADRLTTQPTLAVARGRYRVVAAIGWPDLSRARALTETAAGNAILAARPDLLDRFVRSPSAPLSRDEARALFDRIRRGRDAGSFLDRDESQTGWRCVAVPASFASDPVGGLIGVTVYGGRIHNRELLNVTFAATETITSHR